MGGAGTWYIGGRNQDLFTAAIPVAAPIVADDVDWHIPVFVIHSVNDELVSFDAAKKHADQLRGKGAMIEFRSVDGLSHFQSPLFARFVGEGVSWIKTKW